MYLNEGQSQTIWIIKDLYTESILWLLQMEFEADENLLKIQDLEQQVQDGECALAVSL